ncbi:MAG: hypothetical protein BWY91_01922 [bacterium ADurb.BinA028]|nr:MAG: hypothetical protein BWY91_01922 [bacterium ADurb.BinA028]
MPKPAPCHESRNACQRPDASVETRANSPPARPVPRASSSPPRNDERNPTAATMPAARVARTPALLKTRSGSDAERTLRSSASSATGPDSMPVPAASPARAPSRSGVSASWTRSAVCRSDSPEVTNRVARSRRRSRRRVRKRHRAAIEENGRTSAPRSANSTQACAGRLSRSRTRAEPIELSSTQSASPGTAHGEQRVRATRRAARRAARRSDIVSAGTVGSGPWGVSVVEVSGPARTRAAGTTTTRSPANWARHPRSRASPGPAKAGSKPPTCVRTSRRTSWPGRPTARTSVRVSYCPWSGSPRPGAAIRRPDLVS